MQEAVIQTGRGDNTSMETPIDGVFMLQYQPARYNSQRAVMYSTGGNFISGMTVRVIDPGVSRSYAMR